MVGHGEIAFIVVSTVASYFFGFIDIPGSLERMKWSSASVSSPTKLQDLHANDWSLVRRVVALSEVDRKAASLSRALWLWIMISLIAILVGVGFGLSGALLSTSSDEARAALGGMLRNFGFGWCFAIPIVLSLYAKARAASLESQLSNLKGPTI